MATVKPTANEKRGSERRNLSPDAPANRSQPVRPETSITCRRYCHVHPLLARLVLTRSPPPIPMLDPFPSPRGLRLVIKARSQPADKHTETEKFRLHKWPHSFPIDEDHDEDYHRKRNSPRRCRVHNSIFPSAEGTQFPKRMRRLPGARSACENEVGGNLSERAAGQADGV